MIDSQSIFSIHYEYILTEQSLSKIKTNEISPVTSSQSAKIQILIAFIASFDAWSPLKRAKCRGGEVGVSLTQHGMVRSKFILPMIVIKYLLRFIFLIEKLSFLNEQIRQANAQWIFIISFLAFWFLIVRVFLVRINFDPNFIVKNSRSWKVICRKFCYRDETMLILLTAI